MKIFLRILKYVKPYSAHLISSLICILFFTIFSSATLVSVIPFLRTIFYEQTQIANEESANSSQLSLNEDQKEIPGSGLFSDTKKNIEEKVNQFFIGDDRRQALARICVLILIIIFLKNLFDYFQAYLMAHVE